MLTLTIPAPCEPMTANMRLHHHVKAARTRNWRLRAALQARLETPMPFAHVTYWIHATTNRRRDVANYYPTVKACLDGVVDAGVLPDDDDLHVIGPDPRTGEIADHFTVTITLDPDCDCFDCETRFGDRKDTA